MNTNKEKLLKGMMIATWQMSLDGVKKGSRLLDDGASLDTAVIEAIKTVEDNPNFVSVGYGGLPNQYGEVELDAGYMDGDSLGAGAVITVKNIRNPIEVAADLSKRKRNCVLAGNGAEQYARENGFPFRNMLTEASFCRYLEERDKWTAKKNTRAYEGHDTVCVIGQEPAGRLVCGVSTSGLYMKDPGRVGDSPLIGSGFYADSRAGAAAATGVGEDIMKGCLSFAIVEKLKQGIPVQQACEESLFSHLEAMEERGYGNKGMSVIAMDRSGYVGAATTLKEFPFVVSWKGICRIYIASWDAEGRTHRVFLPDAEELKRCGAD